MKTAQTLVFTLLVCLVAKTVSAQTPPAPRPPPGEPRWVDLVIQVMDEGKTVVDAFLKAYEQAHAVNGEAPKYPSAPALPPTGTGKEFSAFTGSYTFSSPKQLAIFSDDGCLVTVMQNGATICHFDRYGMPQHLPAMESAGGRRSFHVLPVTLEANVQYDFIVWYSNVLYRGSTDIDGCTLFAFDPIPALDVLVLDPTAAEMDSFRTAKFGIFRTLLPTIKITLGQGVGIEPGQLQVIVDDGDDGTNDWLDITTLFDFDPDGLIGQTPSQVPVNTFPGPNQKPFRGTVDDPNYVLMIYPGENRIRLRLLGITIFEGFFMCYEAADRTQVGVHNGIEPLPGYPDIKIMSNHIMLRFQAESTDAGISEFLFSQQLRPQGVARDIGLLQVRDSAKLVGNDLVDRITQLDQSLDPDEPGDSGVDQISEPLAGATGELFPSAFSTAYAWNAINPSFNSPVIGHHHHFVIQTFAAHQLIKELLASGNSTDTVTIFQHGKGAFRTSPFHENSPN
jgi:hypothetical protein